MASTRSVLFWKVVSKPDVILLFRGVTSCLLGAKFSWIAASASTRNRSPAYLFRRVLDCRSWTEQIRSAADLLEVNTTVEPAALLAWRRRNAADTYQVESRGRGHPEVSCSQTLMRHVDCGPWFRSRPLHLLTCESADTQKDALINYVERTSLNISVVCRLVLRFMNNVNTLVSLSVEFQVRLMNILSYNQNIWYKYWHYWWWLFF